MPRRTSTAVAVVSAVLAVAALGIASAAPSSSAAPLPDGPPRSLAVPAAGEDRLTIRYRERPGGPVSVRSLYCHPAGGSHPRPPAACAAIDRSAAPFAPVPQEAVCTRIYGGPHRAQISGVWRGRPVDAAFSRSGGCEIARWETLVPALPAVR